MATPNVHLDVGSMLTNSVNIATKLPDLAFRKSNNQILRRLLTDSQNLPEAMQCVHSHFAKLRKRITEGIRLAEMAPGGNGTVE